jgi:hypothetical protein
VPSNAQRGSYYKSRTKRWLIAQGYQVADLEVVHWIFTPKGRIATKRDQFGSDLLAMNPRGLLFIQVKGGEQARGSGQFPAARRAFEQYEYYWPPDVRRCVIAWAPRAKQPRIIEM